MNTGLNNMEFDLEKSNDVYEQLRPYVRKTPVMEWDGHIKEKYFGKRRLFFKMEFLQHSGSFKVRGAFSSILNNLEVAKSKGVVAVSRGNHACAVCYAARELGISAKLIVAEGASKRRLSKCKAFGGEVIFVKPSQLFETGDRIQREEGRFMVHPYDGEFVAFGTAGVAREFLQQVEGNLGEIYVACGGGGLLAGVAGYTKIVVPSCSVWGVEPEGCAGMSESLKIGTPFSVGAIHTIADSLGAPDVLPYSFALCRQYADGIILVDDQQILKVVKEIYDDLTLVFEPSGVVSLVGAKERASSSDTPMGIILCGANIDILEYQKLVSS